MSHSEKELWFISKLSLILCALKNFTVPFSGARDSKHLHIIKVMKIKMFVYLWIIL